MSQTIRNSTKTTRPILKGFNRPWYIVDASKDSLGRVSTIIANLLTGKNRADYAADTDMGAMVVVVNSDKVILTGQKPDKKVYFRHSGRIGGIHHRSFKEQMEKDSTKVVFTAVNGMIPKNRQRDNRAKNRLFIFAGSEHNLPHKMTAAN